MTVWTVPATITRVVDGDTLEAALDLGWKITYHAKIRLTGVNCPEMSTPGGSPARNFTHAWLTATMPADGVGRTLAAPVMVISHSLDKYGRVLGEIRRKPPGTPGLTRHLADWESLADALITNGHAVPA